MTTQKKATQAGARRVTAGLDTIATLLQTQHAALGIPEKVAMDVATRLDMVADSIDRKVQASWYNPADIAEEVPGPEQFDPNNPFMAGHFTQERFDALTDKQVSGELAANAAAHKADPRLASARAVLTAALKLAEEAFPGAAPPFGKDDAKKDEKKDEKKAADDKPAADKQGEPEAEGAKVASYFGLFRGSK